MSIYGESAAEPEAGAELVVPDYTAPAASGPTAMGSDGSSVAAGGAAPAAAGGGAAKGGKAKSGGGGGCTIS